LGSIYHVCAQYASYGLNKYVQNALKRLSVPYLSRPLCAISFAWLRILPLDRARTHEVTALIGAYYVLRCLPLHARSVGRAGPKAFILTIKPRDVREAKILWAICDGCAGLAIAVRLPREMVVLVTKPLSFRGAVAPPRVFRKGRATIGGVNTPRRGIQRGVKSSFPPISSLDARFAGR